MRNPPNDPKQKISVSLPIVPSSGRGANRSEHKEPEAPEYLDAEVSEASERTVEDDRQLKKYTRKRKRQDDTDNLEDAYLERLAKIDQVEAKRSKKPARIDDVLGESEASGNQKDEDEREADGSRSGSSEASNNEDFQVLQHESSTVKNETAELEKANRTVFLANVSTTTIKSKTARRDLLKHLTCFLPELPSNDGDRRIESIRFRSTAFTTSAMPKKAAFAKKELMDATTKSTNAYVVYNTAAHAREAVKQLNGTIVLERHLRVDGVAHPAPIDHRRCVFVGNLGFVDDDSLIKAAEDPDEDTANRKRKSKPPGDVEEGLWRQFKTAGEVESVRVVRDQSTRVGKGFAYVQFKARINEISGQTLISLTLLGS